MTTAAHFTILGLAISTGILLIGIISMYRNKQKDERTRRKESEAEAKRQGEFETNTKLKLIELEKEIAEVKCAIAKHESDNIREMSRFAEQIETMRKENKEDFKEVFKKLDSIINK